MDDYLEDTELLNYKLSPAALKLQETFVDELKDKQKAKLKEFRMKMQDVLQAHHNDFYLYKWLKARKFDVKAAENMLRAHLKWRNDMGMDTIFQDFKPSEVLRKYVPMGICGHDRDDSTLWFVPFGNFDARGIVYSAKLADIIKYYTMALELISIINQKQTDKVGKLITSNMVICDLENFKFQEYIWKPVFHVFTQILMILESNYPESLKKIFIINAPKIFTIFFTMIKPFLSEDTRSKVVIYPTRTWEEDLVKAVDPDQLPKIWGGNLIDEVDGNPYCSSKIIMGGKIPESYYLAQSRRPDFNEKLLSATVEKQNVFTVDVTLEKPESTIFWSFQTEENNIGFGITYKPFTDENGVSTTIVPITRFECHLVPEEGSLFCPKTGIYTLIFDNKYSWYKNKKLLYEVHVIPPNPPTSNSSY